MTVDIGSRGDRIRSLRAAKPRLDPWAAPATCVDRERRADGSVELALTVFLVGRECPFTCVFCDLWRNTLDGATPVGSLPAQLDAALAAHATAADAVKLYNASNFFDPQAVPDDDMEAIAGRVECFGRVTVESHPRFVGERCLRWTERLEGRLEVAMGLETVHAGALSRLNKQMDLPTFDRAAEVLRSAGVGLRAFVLVGVPFLAQELQLEWAVRSVDHAIDRGAVAVALIPVRGGNGEMERLLAEGAWTPPPLALLEAAFDEVVERPGVAVTADGWDLERLRDCDRCFDARRARLERMNLTGRRAPRGGCDRCGWS